MIAFVIATLILAPYGTLAMAQSSEKKEAHSGEKMVVDVIVARPLGIVATAFGTALFIVSLPFSAAGGNTKAAYEKLVVEPAKFTFKRPLGSF